MKLKKVKITLVVAAFVLVGWIVWGNLTVGVTRYVVRDRRLPSAFDQYRIAVISDLHNAEFGKNNCRIAALVAKETPDLIAITGDIIDATRADIEIAVSLVEQLTEIAPVYYVTGNHEARIDTDYLDLKEKLLNAGVIVLQDQTVVIERSDERILLAGLEDPRFVVDDSGDSNAVIEKKLNDMNLPADEYCILLSHRPEVFDMYVSNEINLVISGHAHGGQFRLPFFGGLYAPNQGFFPKYDAGMYTKKGTTMIISRGIGNSRIPIRLNNRPELVIVELHREEVESNL